MGATPKPSPRPTPMPTSFMYPRWEDDSVQPWDCGEHNWPLQILKEEGAASGDLLERHRQIMDAIEEEIRLEQSNSEKKRKVYEMEQRGEFPRRFALTPRCVVWDLAEVEAWLTERLATARRSPIDRAPHPDVRKRKARPVKAPDQARA